MSKNAVTVAALAQQKQINLAAKQQEEVDGILDLLLTTANEIQDKIDKDGKKKKFFGFLRKWINVAKIAWKLAQDIIELVKKRKQQKDEMSALIKRNYQDIKKAQSRTRTSTKKTTTK